MSMMSTIMSGHNKKTTTVKCHTYQGFCISDGSAKWISLLQHPMVPWFTESGCFCKSTRHSTPTPYLNYAFQALGVPGVVSIYKEIIYVFTVNMYMTAFHEVIHSNSF